MNSLKTMLCLMLLGAASQLQLPLALGAEAGESAMSLNPLTVDPDLAIFTAVVFFLLLAVLTKFAWRPLMAGLDLRERSIADMIAEAERSNEEAAQRLQQYEQKLEAATAETQEMMAKAKRDAMAAGEELVEKARQQAERERERAVEDIRLAKAAAIQEIADQSADLAFTLAGKLIQRELKPEDHASLVRETLREMPSEN
jgi:F-type H+-transporting ATPase subunit b